MFAALIACWTPGVFAQTGVTADARTDAEVVPGVESEDGLIESYDRPAEPDESHASREADGDLLALARQHPERFTGKTLMFRNGETIGEIQNIRRKLDNLYLYMIVDATRYFNSPTTYAVPVRDVESMNDDAVLISMAEGMHLRGLTYYPEDYTSAGNSFPESSITD